MTPFNLKLHLFHRYCTKLKAWLSKRLIISWPPFFSRPAGNGHPITTTPTTLSLPLVNNVYFCGFPPSQNTHIHVGFRMKEESLYTKYTIKYTAGDVIIMLLTDSKCEEK